MVVPPASDVRLLVAIPLDPEHRNTLSFEGKDRQAQYFMSMTSWPAENYTYVRKDRVLKVGVDPDRIMNCNYMMYRNSAFSNRWYYAFIDSIEYENNSTALIRFTMDWFQTYFYDAFLHPCYVEREHSYYDTFGQNLVPENLDYGNYIYGDDSRPQCFSEKSILVAATVDASMQSKVGGYYGEIYSGLVYHNFETAEAATNFINQVVSNVGPDAIVGINMYPNYFFTNGTPKTYNFKPRVVIDTIDGYKPRNKKLLTYPYNFLYVTNNQGNAGSYKYEFFEDIKNIEFTIQCDVSLSPGAVLTPLNYKNKAGNMVANVNEIMTISGWPQCSWTSDVFKAYIAQNGAKTAVNVVGGGISAASGIATAIATKNPMAAVNGIMPIANDMASLYDMSNLPAQAHGSVAPSTMFNYGFLNFTFMPTYITAEFAKIIDGYFDMFGYATHQVKMPEFTGRPNWNYIKTLNCVVTGSIPLEAKLEIENAFNHGVTFWHNYNTFGDYSQPNPPVGGY